MEAYIAGDSKTGDKLMKESKPLWDTALAGCGEIAKRMSYLSGEMDKIQKRSDWDQISKKIYEDNKPPIDLNVSDMLDDWKKGDYFLSGYDAGKIEHYFILIEPIRFEIAPSLFIAGWYYGLTN